MRRSVRSMLAVLALITATLGHARPEVGAIPSDELGRDRDGHDVRVSGLRGKVVVVSFWASWCGYCRKELPVLAALQKLKGTADLQVIGVNHDDTYEAFKDLRNRWKSLDIILTYDPPDGRIGKPYDIKTLPFMVMIGRDGRIAHVYTGYDENMLDTIMSDVDDLLAQPAPGATAATVPPPASS
ncbi:TlpA disulfide reductase family protein [Dyella terrae]|uniref:TlpA disulfide reductase family protein n=1 Tax=Dyella terrae TaxID=522259 RepID=UPI001EFEEF62|nr:TlpA disulfide reductase family protein [Dyella terrae]ULU27513.1 TlpA family protein disulfide reductase [Dyella terrae]